MGAAPYAAVDRDITAWATEHRLQLFTEYKDDEVRSVDIASKWWRQPFQIWVDPPDNDGSVSVHASDRKSHRFTRRVIISEVRNALEEALDWVEERL